MAEQTQTFKIFDLYETDNLTVEDPGLKNVINLKPKLILKSNGRNFQKFGQTKVNFVERLINQIGVAGHRGKKHKIILGLGTGKYSRNARIVLNALTGCEKDRKKSCCSFLKALKICSKR